MNQENMYKVPEQIWNRLDSEERNSFNVSFQRTSQRRSEIIQSLSEECRPDMEAHFLEITATVCAYFVAELNQAAV